MVENYFKEPKTSCPAKGRESRLTPKAVNQDKNLITMAPKLEMNLCLLQGAILD